MFVAEISVRYVILADDHHHAGEVARGTAGEALTEFSHQDVVILQSFKGFNDLPPNWSYKDVPYSEPGSAYQGKDIETLLNIIADTPTPDTQTEEMFPKG